MNPTIWLSFFGSEGGGENRPNHILTTDTVGEPKGGKTKIDDYPAFIFDALEKDQYASTDRPEGLTGINQRLV